MNRVNAASFAVDDVKLFLDTHPCDKEAMEYFEKYQEMRENVLCANMPNTTVRSPSTLCAQTPVKTGTGSMSHGRGRKEDANLCGIMRNDCSIR